MLTKWNKQEPSDRLIRWYEPTKDKRQCWVGWLQKREDLTFPDGIVCRIEKRGTYRVTVEPYEQEFDELVPDFDDE